MILAPYGKIPGFPPTEIVGSIGGDGRYLCSGGTRDAQHHINGEDGMYSDSPLGRGGFSGPQVMAEGPSQGPVPSDFQYANNLQYVPSTRGWVATQQGFIMGPYRPQPAPPASMMYPISPLPLGDAASAAAAATNAMTGYATPYDAAAAAEDTRRKNVTFWMSVLTGSVVGMSALIAIFRGLKGIRHDQLVRSALEAKLSR